MELFIIVIALVLIGITLESAIRGTRQREQWRIRRVEQKLDRLLQHFGIDDDDAALEPVKTALRQGNVIGALKILRQLHPDLSLSEARMRVEALKRDL